MSGNAAARRIPNRAAVWLVLWLITVSAGISCAAAPSNPPALESGLKMAADEAQTPPPASPEPVVHWWYPLNLGIGQIGSSDAERSRLVALYQANNWEPLFLDADFRLTAEGRYVVERLTRLLEEGFDPTRFPTARLDTQLKQLDRLRDAAPTTVAGGPEPARYTMRSVAVDTVSDGGWSAPPETASEPLVTAAAQVDVTLLACLTRWIEDMNPFESFEGLKTLRAWPSLAGYLDSLKPQDPGYATLERELARYLRLAAGKDPLPIDGAEAIHPGASGPMVTRLQRRLELEGYYSGPLSGRFDTKTKAALEDFQRHHSLPPDGVFGAKTRAWLNASFADKATLLAAALRTLRQSEARLHQRFVRINVPEYLLEYHRDGQVVDRRRIVVGRSSGKRIRYGSTWIGENQTPSVASRIQRVIVNPRWYVPERIRLELAAKIAANPNYLNEQGFVSMQSAYSFGGPRIYQEPGRHNPLGKVKFEFPNPYGIYLHDTTEKHLFQRSRRDFSHGCIRVERAAEFAELLLRDDQNPSVAKLPSYLAGSTQRFIELQTPLPIVIEYAGVNAGPDGRPVFHGDPYGRLIDNQGRGFPL